MTSSIDYANMYTDLGLSVIPLLPKSKRPNRYALKQANYINGNGTGAWTPAMSKLATRQTLRYWFYKTKNNIGIVCGSVSGNLVCIDFDNIASGSTWLQGHHDFVNTTPMQLTSSGFHVLVRVTGGLPKNGKFSLTKNAKNWVGDIRSNGGYIVAPPSIHPSGSAYLWVNSPEHGIAEIKSLAELGIYRRETEVNPPKRQRKYTRTDPERVRKALAQLPTQYSDDYFLWCFVGMALKTTFGDDGFQLWDEFSQQSKKYNPKALHRQWKSFQYNGRLTVGSIFYWAKNG